jgi:hypothetical protein
MVSAGAGSSRLGCSRLSTSYGETAARKRGHVIETVSREKALRVDPQQAQRASKNSSTAAACSLALCQFRLYWNAYWKPNIP